MGSGMVECLRSHSIPHYDFSSFLLFLRYYYKQDLLFPGLTILHGAINKLDRFFHCSSL